MSGYVQTEFCSRIAEALRAAPALAAAKVVVEDLADVDAEIARASTGVVVAVAATGHTRGRGRTLSGRLEFEVLCTEVPRVNRAGARRGFLSAQRAAEAAARALDHLAVDGFGTLVYESMRRQDEGERAQTLVSLHAEQSINPDEALAWGLADGTQAYGEIVALRTRRGGTALFEAGRDGRARFAGVGDPHVAVDLTAAVTAGADAFPAPGERFTCPAYGVRTTFVCTLSELSEEADDGRTVHLAGRTVTD